MNTDLKIFLLKIQADIEDFHAENDADLDKVDFILIDRVNDEIQDILNNHDK